MLSVQPLSHLERLQSPVNFEGDEAILRSAKELSGFIGMGRVHHIESRRLEKRDLNPVILNLSALIIAECNLVFENFLEKYPDFSEELESRITHGINSFCKREKINDREKELITKFWKNRIYSTTPSIIGTLCLGPVAVLCFLSDVIYSESPKELLRIFACSKLIQQLNISEKSKSGWMREIAEKMNQVFQNAFPSSGLDDKRIKVAEYVGLTIAKTEFKSLGNKSLMELKCWNDTDEILSDWAQEEIGTNRDLITHLKENQAWKRAIHLAHIISGFVLAVLNNNKSAEKFPKLIEKFFYLINDKSIVNLYLEPGSDCMEIPQEKVEALCQFIAKYARNKEAKEVAEKAKTDKSELKSIWNLDFSCQGLDTLVPEIRILPNLSHLTLSTSAISDLPAWLKDLKNLKVIDLRGNQLTEFPVILTQIPSLVRIHITENPIQEVPESMKKVIWELPFTAKWKD